MARVGNVISGVLPKVDCVLVRAALVVAVAHRLHAMLLTVRNHDISVRSRGGACSELLEQVSALWHSILASKNSLELV